jgi:hypothetical protein
VKRSTSPPSDSCFVLATPDFGVARLVTRKVAIANASDKLKRAIFLMFGVLIKRLLIGCGGSELTQQTPSIHFLHY